MKVEAKYKGRSRYYPGRISRIHRDGSCDIDYDDGEKERLVDPSLVRALESGKGERTGSGDRLEEGMKVEAKYKGRSRYYPGRISRVHRDGSCDIDYDDGEKERLVDPSLVRALESGKGERTGGRDRLEEGMKVEAKYKGRSRYYPGRISRIHRDGSCDIDYDDGEKERLVDPSLVRALESGKGERTGSGDHLEEGMRVEAKYKGRSRYYPGRISRVHRDGSCDIDYDDGEKERLVDPSLVRVLESSKGERTGSGDRLEEGMRVEAKYKGRSRYYPGRISRIHRDGSCDIDYDDGEKERLVDPSLVRVLESSKGERTGSGDRLEEGMKVEAKYKGRSRYYPGRISRIHRDGSCDIDYDDGEKKRLVDPSLVRALESGKGERTGSGDRLEEGMRVEAKYKGRSRYYPGRISRVHRDGSCDIDYDDGEKERLVDPSLVRVLESGKGRGRSRSRDRGGRPAVSSSDEGGGLLRGSWVEACWRRASQYSRPKRTQNWAEGEVLACHGDGTCTIKYSDGQTEEGVPESCVRAPAAAPRGRSRDRRSASRGRRDSRPDEAGSGVWRAVERMSKELARRAGVERKKVSSSMLEREKDEVLKTDMVLGRSESARFRREFNKADFSRDGELTTADTVREFLRASDGAGRRGETGGYHRLDFPAFVQAYAWVFYRGGSTDESDSNGDSERNHDDDSGSSSSYRTKERGRRRTARSSSRAGNRTSGERLTSRKLGYPSPEKSSSRSRGRRQGGGSGIGEEAELRRWAKRLGEKQMRRLERVFNEWAVEDDGSDGDGSTVEVRDLERCFKELGRDDVQRRELRAWCDGADLAPGDTLSLADFAYAYHSMFVDTTGEGTAEQHEDLIRRVSVGRSGEQAAMLARARQVFEELDEDRDGEIPRKVIGKFLAKGVGAAVKPSVAEAFAKLRLHAQPAEARAAGEAAKRYVENVISAPGDARFWRINAQNDAFFAKLGRHKGGNELLAAVGFCDELRVEAGKNDSTNSLGTRGVSSSEKAAASAAPTGGGGGMEHKQWLVLEGTVGANGKPIKAVGAAQLKILRAARDEVDAELLALEGTPSVSASLRALRESPSSSPDTPPPAAAVRAAAELLLAYVTNALQDPRNPRVHRVRSGNPAFQRALGRLGGCEGAMTAIGFEPRDRGTVFVLREVGAGAGKEREEVGTANFRFPALDPATEAFLWRRKADLEAAIEAMPATAAATAAPQSAPGRAAADLQDSRDFAAAGGEEGIAAGTGETARNGPIQRRRSSTAEPPPRSGSSLSRKQKQPPGRRTKSEGPSTVRGRDSRSRRPRGASGAGGMGSVGAAAATALLAAADRGGSAAASGARGLQLAMIKEAFSRLDMDGDGYITPADLGLAFRNMGRDASDRTVLAWIRRRDIYQDGRVSLDEFVASFQALIPRDTPGWAAASSSVAATSATGRTGSMSTRRQGAISIASATTGKKTIAMDDGASEVAAAFGRIRLSGSPAECRAAAEFALDYCRRVRDSPTAPLHWRIPLNSKRFSSTVGRLLGGVELMQAIGLRLEENGTVLALRNEQDETGRAGGKWDRVPESLLQRLDASAKELAAQMRGIDHPEVADLAAVSAAVARLRDSTGNAGPHLRCVETAAKYLGNALEHPTMGKYRVVNTSNAVFLRDVVAVQGGVELMVALGFREDADGHLVLSMDTDLTHLTARKLELDAGLAFLRAAAATAPSDKKTLDGSDPGPRKTGTQQASATKPNGPVASRKAVHQTLPLPKSNISGGTEGASAVSARGRSESPGRTAAAQARLMNESLGREVRSRRAAQLALEKRDRDVERLEGEVAAFKEKEASALPVRDALTFARMEERDRAVVSHLTSKLGLDMTNAAQALAWAEDINKRLTLASDGNNAAAAQQRRGRRSFSARQGRRTRPATSALGGAATRLSTAVTAGKAVLEVARPEIFRAGCKLVLGSGASAGQEGRFVTAVVGFIETAREGSGEAAGGGYVVLETPVKLDHPEGAKVVNGRPGRVEAAAYRKRQVVSMVKNSVLRPIIDDAARLGEDVLSARAAQSAFERRSVHKYVFAVVPLRGGGVPPTGHDSGSGRGIAVFPEIGQVVSVSGKSTLVSHRETLALQYLRRSFLRIGRRSAWGEISAAEISAELRTNPILAAALAFPNGGGNEMPGEERAGARALREIYRRRHRRTLDGNRRRHREAFDGRSSDSNGNKPNRTEKGKGNAVKTRDAVADAGGDFHRRPLQQHQHGGETAITWPEFVGAFIPLGRLAFEGGAHVEQEEEDQEQGQGVAAGEESNRGSGRGSPLLLTRRRCGNNGTTTSGEGLVDEDEMQLLRVAFASTAGCGGERIGAKVVVSLAELRAASSALDGEDPPEGAVRKALGRLFSGLKVNTTTRGSTNATKKANHTSRPQVDTGRRELDRAGPDKRYSIRDFVLLRAVMARQAASEAHDGDGGGCGGPGFASGWRMSALMHLRRAFVETFDSTGDNADTDTDTAAVRPAATKELPPSATLSADDFVSRAMADPVIVQFLGMRITTTPAAATSGSSGCLTLREALRELVVGRGKRSRSKARQQFDTPPRLRWDDVEGLLFEPHDPTEVLGNPSSTVSVTDAGGAGEEGEEVYELAADTEAGIIYALMTDGEVKVYDAAGPLGGGGGGGSSEVGGPLWTSQVITHDPSPRSLGTETRERYRRWREGVGLDDNSGPGDRSTTAADARLRCKNGARHLLRLQPRARILFPCPGTGLLLVNSSAGDRCVRFHETAALRRICRTRLDLPPPPRSSCTDGQGIFDLMAVLDGGGGGGARSSGGGGGGSGGSGGGRTGVVGTTECSLVDLVFLPEVSVLLGLVGGRPEVQAFCSETGLVLAVLCGHALPVSCMLWIPSQLMLATGSADTTVRVWDIGAEIVPHADEWARFKRECLFPINSSDRLEKQAQHVDSSCQNQGYPSVSSDISALENALVRGQDEGGSSKNNNSGTDNTMSAAPVSKDNARRALRSLRPEVLRQAGARAVWRTGWVTAVLDHHAGRAGSLNRQTVTGGATTAGGSAKNARTDPLIEVTYDDGTIELGVDSRRLRRPEEAYRHEAKGNGINGGTDSATPSVGPDWERRPVRPVVDARVAVYGFCKARLCELVIGMIMGGVVGGGAVDSPAPPTRLDILTTLQVIRARAACAAAVAGDKYINNDDDHGSARGCADGHQDDDRLDDDRLASPAALEAALEAMDLDTRSREGNVLTSLDSGGGERMLPRWNGLRLPVPCKHLLSSGRSERGGTHSGDGNRSPVTCLTYLPLSMLLVSGHSDGRVRVWDPCDRRHKLAPPPPQSLRALGSEDRETQSRKGGRRSGRHHRLFPGSYATTAEEWTEKGRTFSCVATFGAVPAKANTTERRGGAAGKNGRGGFLKIRELNSIVLPGGGAASLIVPDPESVRAARAMDEEEPWDPASKIVVLTRARHKRAHSLIILPGNGGGFFYFTSSGDMLSVPSPKGFEEHYVLLDDASFFEVSGPLAAAQGGEQGGGGEGVAASLRAAFRARAGVLRVLYAASTGPRAVDAMARQMRDTGVAARPRRALDALFPGQRLAVFYREGDGPDRDITETVNFPGKGASHPTDHTAVGKTYCVEGSAEFLRVEVCGDRDGGDGGGGHRARAASVVSLWAIGRVSLRVEARSFDEALGEDRRAAATSAFMASWALTMQNLRGVCSERAFAARSRANAEARLIARVSCGLRLCSLDRACGEEVADAIGTAALKQALAAGLRLPSRFPASATSPADRHSSAVYLQAAKVLRYLMITGAQENARGRETGTGLGVTLLLQSLKQAAFHPAHDPITRHFLRPMLTPAFQEAVTGGARQDNRTAERTIQWDGLRAALDAAVAHPQQWATTEAAFTILVRFGQAPVHGTALEGFAKNAEELGLGDPPALGDHDTTPTVRSGSANRAAAALSTTCLGASAGVIIAKGTGQADERCPSGLRGTLEGAAAPEPGGCGEASSVLLGAGEIADLAAELDPMRRIDRAFAALAETFDENDASSVAGAAGVRGRRRQRHYRSPLHSYAVARRCRNWTNKLEEVGDILTTTQLRLGRRGQDLLLAGTADTTAPVPPDSRPPTAMPEHELIAQAKAVMASAARRQLDEADSGSNARVVDGKGHDGAAILTAQIHRHAPLPDRSKNGVRAFEGRGFYHGRGAASRRGDAGEPVVVLEVSPAFARREPTTTDGGHGRRTIGENLAFAASVLSVRVLRQKPGLIGVHPGVVVVEGTKSNRRVDAAGERRREESADTADGYSPVPVRIVCERLEGWRSLRDVVLEHGPLAIPSEIAAGEGGEGFRVLRLWGRQLASTLECLSSASLLLRDLRMSTVFVSPDGSTVKIVDFSSLANFSSDTGLVSSEAPKLDGDIHGPTMPLTPSEALTIRGSTENGGVSDGSGESIDDSRHDGVSLVLADAGRPGPFPITAAWDVWTLGILLFELAFGHPPPAYGESLRRGLSSLTLDNATSGGTKVTPVPKLDDLVTAIQYDFLSAVGGLTNKEEGKEGNGVGLATAHVGDSPLEKALGCMSLGAAIGEGDPFHVASSAGVGEGTSAIWDDGRKSVHRFRRAWVRRQLQMEEGGDLDVTTWQTFQEKLRDHLDVSVASAVAATTPWSPISGGDEGGGRKKVGAVHHDHGVPLSSKRMTRQATEVAVDRTAAQLVGADPRGTGRLPFSVVRGVVRDELQLPFSTSEADLVAFCLRDAGGPEGSGGDAEGRDADSPAGQSYREGEGNVLYIPLVHVLRAASLSSAASGPGLSRSLRAGDDTLHPPTPASFVELLFACLEPNPNRRPSSASLLGFPFFSPRRQRTSGEDDLKAAAEYMAGSGNDLSPTMALRDRVESRIQALEAASSQPKNSQEAVCMLNHHSSTRARPVRGRGGDGASANVGVGVLVEALKELEGLVHRSSPPVDRLGEDDYPQQARRVTLGHSKLIGEIFETGVLVRATALALRFLDREEAEAVGRGVSGVGFVEGDPKKTVGARVLLALARVLEGLLSDLRRPGSAVRPYADIVLRCLVTLFLGEEGFLAVRYGNISNTTVGKPGAATESAQYNSSTGGCEGGKSHWQPAISQMFEGLLVEAVGETGEGGYSYLTIQRYIRRCALATHQPGAGALYGDSDDLEGLGDASGDWASSSSDDEDDGRDDDNAGFGDTRGASTTGSSGLIRSHVPPMFVRASTYFAELLALGRVLYALHRGSRTTTGGFASATGRARRQATAYCLTVVRMCCDVGSGGLDKTEPLGWMGGGRELDEDGATLQRTQLLVDARLGEKLAPCLHDPDPDVRRDAVSCALSALQGGHKRLQWVSMSVRRLDPRALLSLGFCTTVWVSAFAAIIRGRGAPALGSANPSRSARESEENLRRMALQCLGYMAEGGDLATYSWRGCRVLSALQGLLSRGGPPGVARAHWGARGPAVGATDTLAEALAHGDRETVDAMENHGLGVRLGQAVEASTRLTRESRRLGVEEVHLLRTYPAGRLARVKLFDRILCHRGDRGGGGGGGRGLQAQLIVSGLVEFIAINMLPDCAVTDIVSTRLPAAFVRYNGTPLVRNEGIAFLERVVARRAGCPAVARETARQAVRHGLPPAECTRLRGNRHRSVRAGVSACLRCLARLESPPVDRALKLAGVPRRAVLRARRDHGAAETRRQWARWVRRKATTLGEAPPTPSTHVAPIEDRTFDNGEPQALARHDVHSTTVTPQPNNIQAALGVGIDAPHRRENRPLSFVAEGADGAAGKSPIPNNTSTAPEKEKNAVLTIEGELSTLSVPGMRGLLAAELATAEESIRVIEVGGSSNGSSTGGGDTSRQAPTATRTAPSSTSDGRSTLKLALPSVIAAQLYTRCLAGVLRVPGLLFVEVEGKGKLAWNGEEIVPDEVAPRRLQSALSPAPATPPLSRQPPPPAYASPPKGDSRTPSSRRHPIIVGSDRPSSVGESRTPPVPDGFKKGKQGVQKTSPVQGGGGAQGISKFSWLGGRAPGTTKRNSDDEEDNDNRVAHRLGARVNLDAAGEDSAPPRGPAALASRSAPLLSPQEQRARVAVALDRMGASVVEETTSSGRKSQGEIWAEGRGGMWTAIPLNECRGARIIFDEQAEEHNQEDKSDDGGLSLEQSLDKEGAIATLERLRVENPDGVALKSYFDDRGGVIDELFGGRVSFQELVRAILILDPRALTLHSPGHTSTLDDASGVGIPSNARTNVSSPGGYFDGMPGRVLGDGGGGDANGNDHHQGHRSRSSSTEEKARSPPPPYPGSQREDGTRVKAAAAVNDRDEERSTAVGVAAAAARLRLERDEMEERRAWAQRTVVGRTFRSSRPAAPPSSLGAARPQHAGRETNRVSSSNKGTGDGLLGQGRPTRRRRRHAQTTKDTAPADVTAASETDETAGDVVSRAFERYASDRDRDRERGFGGGRVGQRPWLHPASSTSFALPGDSERQQRSPWTLRIDGESGAESDGSSAENDDYANASTLGYKRRQSRTDREAQQTGVPPSDIYRGAPLGNGTGQQVMGVNSGDEGGGRSRRSSFVWRRSMEREGAGEHGEGLGGGDGAERYGSGSGDERGYGDGDAAVGSPERERALRGAFDMYDLNGDGFITYLELKAAFQQRGVTASDEDLREWIKQRDTSGTGAVDFADFSKAFVFSS
ncbi:calmodulin-like myosin-light chain [Ectocarpus siliculosus]|uniref:Calmodulin-like myosin-light chain n=1 Tax=Ectocarpus siliculosus TaxID=2880 RepID=D7G1B1_ECTSI|nr:calmodulin-like myosin-light chain [Ectocarpus siliculosus]|eukprot:CBJ33221.1 calmodulin-like myosin-light chain [Ectocarpus siliculosus]